MGRKSNIFIIVLNVIILVASLLVLGLSIWFSLHKGSSLCQKVIQKPLLFLGLALFVVSICGLVGSSSTRLSGFMWVYLLVLFLLILGMIGFTIFTIIVTNKGVGRALSSKGISSHKLGDYSRWLQKYVVNDENWDEIKSCMDDVGYCRRISGGKNADFYKKSLSATQSSCCKPPSYCGLEFHNATYWTMPKSGPAVSDSDCKTWSNNHKQLCFNCKACKTAVLRNIKREWRTLVFINFIILAIVIIVYSVGCCALRNNRRGGYKKYRPGYI